MLLKRSICVSCLQLICSFYSTIYVTLNAQSVLSFSSQFLPLQYIHDCHKDRYSEQNNRRDRDNGSTLLPTALCRGNYRRLCCLMLCGGQRESRRRDGRFARLLSALLCLSCRRSCRGLSFREEKETQEKHESIFAYP